MLISRETDYALRILRALGRGEKLTTTELSRGEQIPQSFAYKIIKKLEKFDLIRIYRGTNGGCELACDLNKVSLLDFMVMMGENLHINSCTEQGFECEWVQSHEKSICHVHGLLQELQCTIQTLLKQYSLQQVLFGRTA